MSHIAERMQAVREHIGRAAVAAGRDAQTIQLLAVSKTFGIDDIAEAARAGQRAFGENYVQEAVAKIDALSANRELEWHLIGPLQSNKCNIVAERFSWVHTVDRPRIATRLSSARAATQAPLNVCIQVNISGEASKSGVEVDEVRALADAIAALPGLRLRGLMGIAGLGLPPGQTREQFRMLRRLFDALVQDGFDIDTLSMGMSADMDAAIAEGATMVRIGQAIFGTREGGVQ